MCCFLKSWAADARGGLEGPAVWLWLVAFFAAVCAVAVWVCGSDDGAVVVVA